jgi:hypothetical protein
MSATIGRNLFVGMVLCFAAALYGCTTVAVQRGRPLISTGLMIVAGPVFMALVWVMLQHCQPSSHNWSLRNISYSAVVGDLFILPPVMALAALGWKHHERIAEFWKSPSWMVISFIIGLVLGIAFHLAGGRADSQSALLGQRLHDSATSWAHNLGVFPAIASALVYAIVPLIVTPASRTWGILILLVVVIAWGGLTVLDGIRAQLSNSNPWHFNQQWLDTEMDWRSWTPRR